MNQLMGASKIKDMAKDDEEAKQNADKLLNKQVFFTFKL